MRSIINIAGLVGILALTSCTSPKNPYGYMSSVNANQNTIEYTPRLCDWSGEENQKLYDKLNKEKKEKSK